MSELSRLKRKAKRLYRIQRSRPGDYDCGNSLYDLIHPERHVAREELKKVWRRIRELDPKAPELRL